MLTFAWAHYSFKAVWVICRYPENVDEVIVHVFLFVSMLDIVYKVYKYRIKHSTIFISLKTIAYESIYLCNDDGAGGISDIVQQG